MWMDIGSLSGSYRSMNIAIVTQLFETLEDNGSDRQLFFAKELVKKGNKVKIITGNFDYKAGCKRFEAKGKIIRKVSGIDVVYVPVYSNIRGSYFKRFIFFVSFIFSCFKELLISARTADVIWAVSTPITVPFVGAIVSKLMKVPLVSEITDVWPDAAVHSGIVKSRFVIRLAEKMESFCYECSKQIICLTQGIEQNILRKGIAASKICLVTNGVDIDLFDNSRFSSKSALKTSVGLENKFVAMYLGAHGQYNSLDSIIEAAIEFRYDDSIAFVFVGDGEKKAHLESFVSSEGLVNVFFYPPVKRIDAPEFLSMADCFLLPNLAGDFFDGNLPNKVFDYLSSNRPIIVAGRVESGRLVEKVKAGFVVDAEEPKQLAEAIKRMCSLSQDERDQMGVRGGDYVRLHYSRQSQSELIISLFERVISDG